ncbi:hypothetical protein JCM9279_006790 [Rhodotorula babjevae]
MALFGHHGEAQQPLEKPAPAHAHGDVPPRSSDATHVGSHGVHPHHQHTTDGMNGGSVAPVGDVSKDGRAWIYGRPTVGQWFKQHWVDILTMAALGAVALGVYEADPAPTRSFAITFANGEIVYPQFAYPLRKNIIPIWAAALIAFFVPFVAFGLVQIRVRSFEDLNTATFGLLYSLINAATFQVFIKWLIGGLRPHFLSVCKPDLSGVDIGEGYGGLYFTRSVCTGDRNEINDSLESLPSGHSTAAWAGLLFLSLYLNGKLKLFADYRPQFWKMLAFFAPLLGAFLIAGSLTIDEYHHWYDVVIGSCIGSASALAAYRMSYAAIWDFRFNHLPLPRAPPLAKHGHGLDLAARRYPYSLDAVSGVQPFAGQWRAEHGMATHVAGAPGDAIKQRGGFASGMGAAGMV